MDRRFIRTTFDSGPELQQLYERLRQVSGPALAPGQTPCCYALSDGPLLRALEKILTVIVGNSRTHAGRSKVEKPRAHLDTCRAGQPSQPQSAFC